MSSSTSWDELVPPDRKTICYFASGVYLYHIFASLLMVAFWKFVNKRVIMYSSIVLLVGVIQYSFAQVLCYIDYLVEISKCLIYSRFVTILGDLQHLTFDIYQMKKILPLLGPMLKNPQPLKFLSWFLFIVRLGCSIAKNWVQITLITPPVGGFTEVGIGLCATFNTPSVLVAVRVGSFLFEMLLFAELVFIMYRLRTDALHNVEPPSSRDSRVSATASIGKLLDAELLLFIVYFIMDVIFLFILIAQNVGQVIPFATIYNAVLPTIIIANILCSRWIVMKRQAEARPRSSDIPQTQTSPTHHDSHGPRESGSSFYTNTPADEAFLALKRKTGSRSLNLSPTVLISSVDVDSHYGSVP